MSVLETAYLASFLSQLSKPSNLCHIDATITRTRILRNKRATLIVAVENICLLQGIPEMLLEHYNSDISEYPKIF